MERSNGAIRATDAGVARFSLPQITVLVGHAGTGKTNTALGFALAEAERGHNVTLADLDVVNPYFRSSDYPELLAEASGIRLIAPVLARTTLDTPSLTGELDVAIEQTAGRPRPSAWSSTWAETTTEPRPSAAGRRASTLPRRACCTW